MTVTTTLPMTHCILRWLNKMRSQKIIFFLSIILTLIAFWNFKIMLHLKGLIVLFHEICHASAALLTGGVVERIFIHGNETGETVISGKMQISFLFVVSAGYIGSSILGGVLLNRGFDKKHAKQFLGFVGVFLILFTHFYSANHDFTYNTGIRFGIIFIILSFISKEISSLILIFLGTSVSLYSVYDLVDFTNQIQHTDAGILANWILGKKEKLFGLNLKQFGILIAIIWSSTSLFILGILVKRTFTEPDRFLNMSNLKRQFVEAKVEPDVAQWFLSRGLDLNGKPLDKDWATQLKKEGMNKHE